MIINYGAGYSHNRTKIRDNSMKPVNNFTQNIAASLIPKKEITLTLSFNNYYNDMIESSANVIIPSQKVKKYKYRKIEVGCNKVLFIFTG